MQSVSAIRPSLRPLSATAQQRLVPAAKAAGFGTAAALIARDQAHLGAVARPAGLGLALLAARNAAATFFPTQTDKPKHAMASAAVTGTVSLLTGNRGWGIAAGVVAGLAKELYDGSPLNPQGDRDFHFKGDLGADAIGIAFGALI